MPQGMRPSHQDGMRRIYSGPKEIPTFQPKTKERNAILSRPYGGHDVRSLERFSEVYIGDLFRCEKSRNKERGWKTSPHPGSNSARN